MSDDTIETRNEAWWKGYDAGWNAAVEAMAEKLTKPTQTYICDPEKNTECKKTNCQTLCFETTHKEFSKKIAFTDIFKSMEENNSGDIVDKYVKDKETREDFLNGRR